MSLLQINIQNLQNGNQELKNENEDLKMKYIKNIKDNQLGLTSST